MHTNHATIGGVVWIAILAARGVQRRELNEVEPVDDEQCVVRATNQVLNLQRVAGRMHRGEQLARLVIKYVGRYGTCTRIVNDHGREWTLVDVASGRIDMHVHTRLCTFMKVQKSGQQKDVINKM